MKTELPEPADYYRPARARELREKAARLERWSRRTVGLWLVSVLGWVGWCFLAYHFLGPVTGDAALSVLAGVAAAFVVAAAGCSRGAVRFKNQAAALEAEHAARYGSLPDEVS